MYSDNNARMQKEYGIVTHLMDCINRKTVTVVEGDVFDPFQSRYGHRQILAFVAEHALAGLGLPFPDLDLSKMKRKEVEDNG